MKQFFKLRQFVSMIVTAVIVMGFSVPFGFAANSTITDLEVNPDPFHHGIPGHESEALVEISYVYNSGGNAQADLNEYIKNEDGQIVYFFGTNLGADEFTIANPANPQTMTREWNGKANVGPSNNLYVPNGEYTFVVESHVADPPDTTREITFDVERARAPEIELVSTPPMIYYTQQGNFTIRYGLDTGSASVAVVRLTITGPLNNNPQEIEITSVNLDGQHNITWNGTINGVVAPVGDYEFTLTAENTIDGFTVVDDNEIEGEFALSHSTPPETCGNYTDVQKNDPDCPAIEFMKSMGAMTGNPDGTFAPNASLQRDQVAKIVLETFNQFNASVDYCQGENPFPDVTGSAWSYQYICRGVDLGVITGYKAGVDAGFYRPGRAVNRAEFLALTLRNLNETLPPNTSSTGYVDVTSGQWFSGYARYSSDNDLFTGNSLFPAQSTQRREVARVIYKLDQLGKL